MALLLLQSRSMPSTFEPMEEIAHIAARLPFVGVRPEFFRKLQARDRLTGTNGEARD